MAQAEAAAAPVLTAWAHQGSAVRDSMSLDVFSLATKRYQRRLCGLPAHIERPQEITSSSAGERACDPQHRRNAPGV